MIAPNIQEIANGKVAPSAAPTTPLASATTMTCVR
jgi:hypothetical protein